LASEDRTPHFNALSFDQERNTLCVSLFGHDLPAG
jgi:hypothetical protein